jgi:hypothetical protein
MIKRNEKTISRNGNRRSGGFLSYFCVFFCAALLLSGFFFAGWQHFASMDYGMKNSRLRRQIDQLEAEKRRLIHAREVSLSAPEIKKAAKKAGLFEPPSASDNLLASADPVEVKAASMKNSVDRPLVQRTSAVDQVRDPAVQAGKNAVVSPKKLIAAK